MTQSPPLQKQLNQDDLTHYFSLGYKKQNQFKIGVEWEKVGVFKDSGIAIPYSGGRGVEAIFKQLVAIFKWQPVLQNGHMIALKKGHSAITLEPGGQVELSGQAYTFLQDNETELYCHLHELKKVSEGLGIVWLGLGMQPVSRLEDIEWAPKERYKIMREVLKDKGSETYRMMKQTASIQVSLDYENEADACQKFKLAMGLAPFFSAIFANSPVSDGVLNGFYSRRAEIWRHTAPERTGLIPCVFKKDFSFKDYAQYALEVPLLFIQRNDRWITPEQPMTFKDFFENGLEGHKATIEDWELHLTTLFTDVRLKNYIEIRSVDCQKKEMGLSVPALIKGVFYDGQSRKAASEFISAFSYEELLGLRNAVPKEGLEARIHGKAIRETAVWLIELAEQGLQRLPALKLALDDEAKYLKPIKNSIIGLKKTPSEVLIACFKSAGCEKEKIERILECAAL